MVGQRRARGTKTSTFARERARLCVFLALGWLGSASGCIGGPHPVPPLSDSQNPTLPNPTSVGASAPGAPALGAAGSGLTDADSSAPLTPPASNAGTAGTASALPIAGVSAPVQSAAGEGGAGGSAASSPSVPSGGDCSGTLSLLRGDAADNVLLVMDRSADMASAYKGEPRWQKSGQALVSAFAPLAGDASLKLGALFYPSASAAAPCLAPSWLCPAPSMPAATPTTCAVNAVSASDQVDLQPAMRALGAMSGPPALYQPIAGTGVPLRESIDQIESVLAQPPSGRTVIILLASAAPTCGWDQNESGGVLTALTQRGIRTRVIALPGANAASMDALTSLAKASGQSAALVPTTDAALQSELQSIALGSLSSCTLAIEPAVSEPAGAHLIAGVHGSERELPRTAADGTALFTISPDGKQLQLLGATCNALQQGDYDSLRIVVGCVDLPSAP